MDGRRGSSNCASESEEEMDLRRGPWTDEEDILLVNYISSHGEGRWNALARSAGLKRTGKSCRLRWLNYLRPDVRRGNITPEEQLLILELHSRWGNRWSKIAQYLPGRTDNEIKNYWRTRVQKQAKQLKCDVNSKQFKDAMKYLWMPRLVEKIRAANSGTSVNHQPPPDHPAGYQQPPPSLSGDSGPTPTAPVSSPVPHFDDSFLQSAQIPFPESYTSSPGYYTDGMDFPASDPSECSGGDAPANTWSAEDIWFWLCDGI